MSHASQQTQPPWDLGEDASSKECPRNQSYLLRCTLDLEKSRCRYVITVVLNALLWEMPSYLPHHLLLPSPPGALRERETETEKESVRGLHQHLAVACARGPDSQNMLGSNSPGSTGDTYPEISRLQTTKDYIDKKSSPWWYPETERKSVQSLECRWRWLNGWYSVNWKDKLILLGKWPYAPYAGWCKENGEA